MFFLKSFKEEGMEKIELHSDTLMTVMNRFQRCRKDNSRAFAITQEEMTLIFRIPKELNARIKPGFFKYNERTIQ